MSRVQLIQGPEGAPNFCFGLYGRELRTRGPRKGEPRDRGPFARCIVFVQTDWDYPALASRFGYVPCECGATDGTVDCPHKTASAMIAEAYDHLAAHDGAVISCSDYGD